MDIEFTELESSMISGVAYDEETETLYVRFTKNGNVIAYHGAEPDIFVGLLNAKSAGKYFHAEIKGKYESNSIKEMGNA